MKTLANPLMQTIYQAIQKRGWQVDAYTIADMVADGLSKQQPESEGILFFDQSGVNQYWLGLAVDPTDGCTEIVKVCGLDDLDMFWSSTENYRCDLSRCLDEVDEHINSTANAR